MRGWLPSLELLVTRCYGQETNDGFWARNNRACLGFEAGHSAGLLAKFLNIWRCEVEVDRLDTTGIGRRWRWGLRRLRRFCDKDEAGYIKRDEHLPAGNQKRGRGKTGVGGLHNGIDGDIELAALVEKRAVDLIECIKEIVGLGPGGGGEEDGCRMLEVDVEIGVEARDHIPGRPGSSLCVVLTHVDQLTGAEDPPGGYRNERVVGRWAGDRGFIDDCCLQRSWHDRSLATVEGKL